MAGDLASLGVGHRPSCVSSWLDRPLIPHGGPLMSLRGAKMGK